MHIDFSFEKKNRKQIKITFPNGRFFFFKNISYFDEVNGDGVKVSDDFSIYDDSSFEYKSHLFDNLFDFIDEKTKELDWIKFKQRMMGIVSSKKELKSLKSKKEKPKIKKPTNITMIF